MDPSPEQRAAWAVHGTREKSSLGAVASGAAAATVRAGGSGGAGPRELTATKTSRPRHSRGRRPKTYLSKVTKRHTLKG